MPLSTDANLNTVPADKEDVLNGDNDEAMLAAVKAAPDTTGGNDVREAIILALLLST